MIQLLSTLFGASQAISGAKTTVDLAKTASEKLTETADALADRQPGAPLITNQNQSILMGNNFDSTVGKFNL